MASLAARNRLSLGLLSGVILGMSALAFASPTLYRVFCQATGFGGTTMRAAELSTRVVDRPITVRFNSDTAPDLPWEFQPVGRSIDLKAGEAALAFYRVTNRSDHATVGTAGYNVTPERAGRYFVKVECFCFTEQVLAAGATADLPVSFYVDPRFADDRSMDDIATITLSYTFFRAQTLPQQAGPQQAGPQQTGPQQAGVARR